MSITPPIAPPVDFNAALVQLPADQFPYGDPCPMNRGIQSLLFHYRIAAEEVANLVIEEFWTKLDFRSANPDGSAEEQALYAESISVLFSKPIRRRRMLLAVRRMLSSDPCAAIVVAPPAPPPAPAAVKRKANVVAAPPIPKKVAGTKAPVSPASSSLPSTSASVVQAKAPTPDIIDISDVSDGSLSDSDAVVEDPASVRPSSSSQLRDLNAHFDDIADEVWVTLAYFDCLVGRLFDCTVPCSMPLP